MQAVDFLIDERKNIMEAYVELSTLEQSHPQKLDEARRIEEWVHAHRRRTTATIVDTNPFDTPNSGSQLQPHAHRCAFQ